MFVFEPPAPTRATSPAGTYSSAFVSNEFIILQNKQGEEVVKPMAPAGTENTTETAQPGAPPTGPAPESPSILGMLWPILIMFGIMYFLVLRPERKRQKQAAELRSNIKKGDKVLMSSGMLGEIVGIEDDFITVEIADKVRVKFQRASVAQVLDSKEKRETAGAAK
ncbi:MAG: preprotein translocase subunit YajC [Planctomycetota bacterium]